MSTRKLEKLIHEIERQPPARRAFWQGLAEHLRERHARFPHLAKGHRPTEAVPEPASGNGGAPSVLPQEKTSRRRRFRLRRLALVGIGLIGSVAFLGDTHDR